MKKTIAIISVFLLLIAGYFVAQLVAKNKIEKTLAKEIEFKEVSVNLLGGKVEVLQAKYDKNAKSLITNKIEVNGFSYYQFLVNNKIEVDELLVNDVEVVMTSASKKDANQQNSKSNFDKEVVVKNVNVNGTFRFQQDSLRTLKVQHFDVAIDSLGLNSKTLKETIPFQFKDYKIQINKIAYTVNQLQDVMVNEALIQPSIITFNTIEYKPRFSREKYVEVIPYEKDLMNLKMKQLQINDYDYSITEAFKLFAARYIELDSLDFSIYRDKTVRDDTREKDLYSKMLREMKLKLAIDSVKVKNTHLEYEELIQKRRPPGRIFFDDLNMNIYTITNQNLDRANFPETKIDVNTSFMGKSPFKVDWNFKINDENDVFIISGNSFNIPESSINSFFAPAMGMKTHGTVNELYFNFRGNSDQASGDLQIAYEDFKIDALKKGSNEKNKFLSAIVSLVVKKDSKANGETKANPEAVKRNKTKSFWNYFWKCLEAGLREAVMKF